MSARETEIIEHVLAAVAEHRLKAGTKLGEQALADIFSCSRAYVRRALVALSAQKVVELKPNRGAFVAMPTPAEARNVFQARRAIEKTIVRNVVDVVQSDDLRRLLEHIEREARARTEADRRDAIRLSGEFHLVLAEIGGNDVLAGFLKELVLRSSLIIGLYSPTNASLCEEDDHRRLVQAIEARDKAAAVELVDTHLRQLESGLIFSEEQDQQNLRAIFAAG